MGIVATATARSLRMDSREPVRCWDRLDVVNGFGMLRMGCEGESERKREVKQKKKKKKKC